MHQSWHTTDTRLQPHGMPPGDVRVPLLSDACMPPVVIGTATMATAMMQGAGTPALAEMITRLDIHPAAALYDTAIALQLAFRPGDAQELQDLALDSSHLFRIAHNAEFPAAIRLLAIVAPGDLMTNTPLDFITSHLDARLDLLFLVPGQDLPATIPDHDVVFFAASETDPASMARMRALFAAWPRPALNDPGFLPALARHRLPGLLAGVPGLCSPATVRVTRSRLDLLAATGGAVGSVLPGCSYPVLIRPLASHAGIGLEKLDSAAALASYLQSATATQFYLTSFVDYRSPDGLFRKYRVAFIDRQPYLCHMAVSQNWMVHYLNAGMAEDAAKREDEAAAMRDFTVTFAARHAAAFDRLYALLPFDFWSIDCAETQDGRLLVFEADTAAIIHLMDPIEIYPYKHTHMRRAFDAFGAMLCSRLRS